MAYHLEFEHFEHVKLITPLVENILSTKPADIFIISDDGQTVATHKILLFLFSKTLPDILREHQDPGGMVSVSVPVKAETVRNFIRILGEGMVFGGDKQELLSVAKCGKVLGIEFKNLQIGGKKSKSSEMQKKRIKETEMDYKDDRNLSIRSTAETMLEVMMTEDGKEMPNPKSGPCTSGVLVNTKADLLTTSVKILRHEASKHRVTNSSRMQKPQLVEELWDHCVKFHTENILNKESMVNLVSTKVNIEIKKETQNIEEVDVSLQKSIDDKEEQMDNRENYELNNDKNGENELHNISDENAKSEDANAKDDDEDDFERQSQEHNVEKETSDITNDIGSEESESDEEIDSDDEDLSRMQEEIEKLTSEDGKNQETDSFVFGNLIV